MRNSKCLMVANNAPTFATVRSFMLSLAAVISMLTLTGCVTKQVAPATVPVVTFQLLPPSTIQAGGQAQLVAVVINDPKMMGIDWNASCVNTNCGCLIPLIRPVASDHLYGAERCATGWSESRRTCHRLARANSCCECGYLH